MADSAIPVRLLSSVAVVGRDNEPIYLRGDLCDVGNDQSGAPSSPSSAAPHVVSEDEGAVYDLDDNNISSPGVDDGDGEGLDASASDRKAAGRGLFGRIKGVVGRREGAAAASDDKGSGDGGDKDDDEEEDDDPFGFFEDSSPDARSSSNSNDGSSNQNHIPAMSLTQQLVLHASLDRFEEMASRSNKGGAVRWRTPGSNSANAMWMGLLCRVEERWNVYGYLTNTGIKFMILVENIHLNRDGSRYRRGGDRNAPPPPSSALPHGGGRESDLKAMFARLHELYVRHTLNPFSQLRSPIRSRAFDGGIVEMARTFNGAAMEQVASLDGGDYVAGGGGGSNGLVWM